MWKLHDFKDQHCIAVVPINDIRPHIIRSPYCLCNPSVEYKNGIQIIIHNAYDGRDRVEKFDAEINTYEN